MYTDLINNKTYHSLTNPKTIVPTPTEFDYQKGFINRYFCQIANDKSGFVFEIAKSIFDELNKNPYWKVAIMRWRITGPIEPVYNQNGDLIDMGVKQSNKNSIAITADVLKNVGLYLPNILQFYK
jgi:hypothetical protein